MESNTIPICVEYKKIRYSKFPLFLQFFPKDICKMAPFSDEVKGVCNETFICIPHHPIKLCTCKFWSILKIMGNYHNGKMK